MYATPAIDKDGGKIELDFPCYGDGTQPVGPEQCGLPLWFSHDEASDDGSTTHRYASCDNKRTWMFTGDANPIEGVETVGHLEDDSKAVNPFEKPKPRAQLVVQIMSARGY